MERRNIGSSDPIKRWVVPLFANRSEAGRLLADAMAGLADDRPVVLALPRGGVPVAAEIAARLGGELELVFVRKISAPYRPDLAIGAVTNGVNPITVLRDDVVRDLNVTDDYIRTQERAALAEIARQKQFFRREHTAPAVEGRTALLVDESMATGASMEAAVKALRRQRPARIIVGIPVAPPVVVERLRPQVDDLFCLEMPVAFFGAEAHYSDFTPLSDKDVVQILKGHGKA